MSDRGSQEHIRQVVVHTHRPAGIRADVSAYDGITLGRICALTSVMIALWVGSGIAAAFAMGRL